MQDNNFLSHAEMSLLVMVFSHNKNDKKNYKSSNQNNNHDKARTRATKYMHEVRLRGNLYFLFVKLMATHGKFSRPVYSKHRI